MDNLFKAVDSMITNPEGFGPGKSIDASFEDHLFQPYYKTSERAWHVSDWTNKAKGRTNQGIVSGFAYKNDDDVTVGFTETNKQKAYKRLTARTLNSKLSNQRSAIQKKTSSTRTVRNNNLRKNQNPNKRNNRYRYGQREEVPRDPSIVLNPANWEVVEEISFEELQNNNVLPESQETIAEYGNLAPYNSALDNITVRTAVALPVSGVVTYNENASADAVMVELANKRTAAIYSTENALALLMATTKTVHSFDLLVTKTDRGIFIDNRPNQGGNAYHVHETVSESLPQEAEHINHFLSLATEAALITNNIQGIVTGAGETLPTDGPSPISKIGSGDVPAEVVYRYRKINLGDDVNVCVRSTIAGYTGPKDDANSVVVKVFNEADPKLCNSTIDWRATLDNQPGAVLASELKNNTARVIRAVGEVYLSGVSTVKIAWVSRTAKDKRGNQQLLHMDTYDAGQLPSAVRTTRGDMWGTLKLVLEFLMERENGKYILMREPGSANALKIYKGKSEHSLNGVTGVVFDH